ncbi:MAG TPA: hypothetical protein VFW02_08340 [Candidatus Limnocylindrales bacterium]|nr:hypothetical protein [Candidatus Limnocylindrales bacterium]
MATETDAARDRVLAARAALGDELQALEASARAAVDIPAKVRRSPAKAAAIAGSAGFVVLGGPKRLFGAARRAVFGPTADLPKRMLPDEIEKTLKKLGDDGDKVRGAIERDFAAYAKEAEKDRGIAPLLSTTVAKPLLARAGRAAAEWFFRTDDEGFQARLADVRDRAREEVDKRRSDRPAGSDTGADADADADAERGGA